LKPAPKIEIPDVYLPPGGLYASAAPCLIGTLVGSCVALTLWSPRQQVGGMNHYLLPRAGRGVEKSTRFGDTAMAILLARIDVLSGGEELEARIYGGASVIANPFSGTPLGEQNIAAAWAFVREHRLRVVDEQVGGRAARRITLDVETGDVSVTQVGGNDGPA